MPTSTTHARKPLAQHIRELALFEPTAFPMLSLYLDLRPDQHGRDRYDVFLRKVLAERARALPARSPERDSFERDAERIQGYLRDELRPSANALALFACTGCGSFFEAVQLDTPIGQHALFVGPVPHIYPLVRLVDEYPRYAAVMLDTNQAQIFVFGLNTVERETEVKNPKTKRTSVGGWSQARYQRHVEHFHLQHVKEVADTLDRIVSDEGIAHVVVIGDEVAVPLLRDQLPPRLQEKLVDVIRLDRTAGGRDILEATLEALRAKDAATDAEQVARMLDAWRAGGLAVAGPADTLEALQLGQVEELLVSSRPQQIAMETSRQVELTAGPVDVSTTEAAASDPERLVIADELVTRAEQTGARVRFIEDPTLREPVGGVGALLRFRL
jgi:peptide subunit release factor 1 (eRF1)